MAENNWTGNANKAPDIVDDNDPFAALTRLVEIELEADRDLDVSEDVAESEPEIDLEAELLQEFERYDAVGRVDGAPQGDINETEPAGSEELGASGAYDDPGQPFDISEADVEAAGTENPAVSELSEDSFEAAAEAMFAGPVPDLDWDMGENDAVSADDEFAAETVEPVFAGPVPDFDDLPTPEPEVEAAFAAIEPDLDFEVDFSAAPSGSSILDDIPLEMEEASADDLMAGELEMSLGIPEKEPPADSEPVSPFSEWKNERLTLNSSANDDSWVPEPVLGNPGAELVSSEAAFAAEADEAVEPGPDASVEELPEDVRQEPAEVADTEQFNDPLEELQAIMGNLAGAPAEPPRVEDPSSDLDIDFDTLEMDLASVELDELEQIEAGLSNSGDEEADAGEPVFDPDQISDVDQGADFIADLEIPAIPSEERETRTVSSQDYAYDFEAEMSDFFAEGGAMKQAASGLEAADNEEELVKAGEAIQEQAAVDEPVYDAGLLNSFAEEVDEQTADEPVGRNRRGGRWMAAASVAAALVVVGGAYAWISSDGGGEAVFSGNDEPPIVLADTSDFKEEPASKGVTAVPNQDKAVYERVEGNTDSGVKQESLIASAEDPVDVAEQTAQENLLPLETGDAQADEEAAITGEERLLPQTEEDQPANEDAAVPAVAPRKVKTMIVMPDGTLVARETPAPETTTQEVAALPDNSQAAVPTAESASADTPEIRPSVEAETSTPEIVPEANAVEDVANATVETETPPDPVVISTPANTPVPTARPVEQPVNVVSTVTDRGTVNNNATATPASDTQSESQPSVQQASLPAGTYVIQIASLTSQESAERTYKGLASRFASVIGGRGVDIRRADIEGKGTYYRVRIPAGTKEEAVALCQRYKAAGGSCLVSR